MAQMLTAIDSLQIVGVRPKPPGLSASLKVEDASTKLSPNDLRSLQSKGFFLTREGQLMSNEGELIVRTGKAVIYTLRFGEVVYGTGMAITAGTDEVIPEEQGGGENQYLFVTADFDESEFVEPPRAPDLSFQGKPDSALTEQDKRNREMHNAWLSWNRKVTQGREKVKTLNDRFADWYYVISHDSFTKLHRNRGDLVVAKKEE
jgi:hypothetical protein